MRLLSFQVGAVALLCAVSAFAEKKNSVSMPSQQWAVDLNSSTDVQQAGAVDANTRINIGYLGRNRLAVALLFPIRLNGEFSSIRDEETWRVLLLILDSSQGRILHSFAFDDFHGEGASSDWLQMGVVNSDELLVIFGNELVRFSSDLASLARRTLAREMKLSNGLHYYDHWRFLTDPTEDRALLVHAKPDGSADDYWISTKDLSDIEAAHFDNHLLTSWSVLVGREVVFTTVDFKAKESEVIVQAAGQTSHHMRGGTVLASFGQGLLFLWSRPSASHTVVNLQGQELYERRAGFGSDRILAATGAATNNRVAFVYGALRNSLFSGWSSNDHIIVLDAGLKREIEVPNPPNKGVHDGDQVQIFNTPALALSPDGKALAVATAPTITLWTLP
jgi:hypothetical protein